MPPEANILTYLLCSSQNLVFKHPDEHRAAGSRGLGPAKRRGGGSPRSSALSLSLPSFFYELEEQ